MMLNNAPKISALWKPNESNAEGGFWAIFKLMTDIKNPKISEKIWAASVKIANDPDINPPISSPVKKSTQIPIFI